ncbi:hypothetical protein [Streptomyces capoamus]|nr:hypothetical protein [Streptomyces capoamus]
MVGAKKPERPEESLRRLNVHEHLRGQLDYEDMSLPGAVVNPG